MAFDAGEIVARIRATADGVKAGINEAKSHLDGFQSKTKQLSAKMSAVGGAMTTNVTLPIVAVAAALGKVTMEAVRFEGQMNEVFTLLPGISDKAMGAMTGDVKGFAKEFGVLPEKVVPALYQSLSAGVPPDNVFAFLEVAQKAAVGGVTDLTIAVDGITSVVNAYGAEVIDAGKASDLMFTAVKLGKTTFGELSGALYNVIPTASALGLRFEDVTAAMATMTAQGVPTSVATIQMRQLLVELSKDGGKASQTFEKLAGKSFRDFIAGGGDVAGALSLMEEHAKKNNLGINDLFGSVEAGNAALALSGKNALGYAKNLQEMNQAAGATETAFEQMEKGAGRQLEKLTAQWAVLKLKIGEKFLPILTGTLIPIFQESVLPLLEKAAQFVGRLAERFGNLSPSMQKIILGGILLAAALGPIILIAAKIVGAISALAPLFGVLKIAFVALTGPIGLVVAAVAALITIGVLLYKNWDTIKEFFTNLWEKVKEIFWSTVEWIKQLFLNYHPAGLVIKHWETIKEFFVNLWETVKGAFSAAWEWIKQLFLNYHPIGLVITHWEQIRGFFAGLWGRIIEIFAGAVTGIRERLAWARDRASEIVGAIRDNTVGRFQGMVDSVKSAFAGITEAILGPVRRARDAVSNIVGSISSTLNKLNPFARRSPSLVDNIRAGIKVIQDEYGKLEDLQVRMPVIGAGAQPAFAGAGAPIEAAAGAGPTIYNGPLVMIQNMTVRSDADIEAISRQLHRSIQASTRARGGK